MMIGSTQEAQPATSLVAVALAAATLVLLGTAGVRLPISNDGAQYLSGATHLAHGEGFRTSLLFFDEQYASGALPAPQTVWPAGLPWLVSIGVRAGIDPPLAGRVLAGISFVATLVLGGLLLSRLVTIRWAVWGGLAWLAGTGALWRYGIVVNSDLPFVAAVLAALLALPRDEAGAARWFWAGLLAAGATFLRYSGLFLIGAIGLAALGSAWPARGRSWPRRLAPAFLAAGGALPVVLLLGRNLALSGTLSGGNSKPVSQPVAGLLQDTVTGLVDLLGGVTLTDLQAGPLHAVAGVAGLAGLGLLGLTAIRGLRRARAERSHLAAVLVLFAVLYLALLIATTSRTMLTYGPRYLLPVVPVAIVIVMRLASLAESRGLALAALAGILVAQAGALPRRLADTDVQGLPPAALAAAVDRIAGPSAPVMIVGESQRFAWALGHPAAIVPHEQFTARSWSDSLLRATVRQYRIRAIVVNTEAEGAIYGPGARALIAEQPVTWLAGGEAVGGYRLLRPIEDTP